MLQDRSWYRRIWLRSPVGPAVDTAGATLPDQIPRPETICPDEGGGYRASPSPRIIGGSRSHTAPRKQEGKNENGDQGHQNVNCLYRYGIHLTPGLAEVRVYAAGFTSFLAGFFRFQVEDLVGIRALKTS